jgi:hypothetical protein
VALAGAAGASDFLSRFRFASCPPCRIGLIGKEERLREFIGLLLCLFLGDAVALLDFADKLIAPAADYFEIAIRELAPLFFYLSGCLFLFAFYLIPIH